MKRLFAYITLPLLLVAAVASAQEVETVSPLDSVQLGNLFQLKAGGALSAGGSLKEYAFWELKYANISTTKNVPD